MRFPFKEKLTRRLTVRFSERHYNELCAYAHEEGFDAATVIRHLVARFVADRDRACDVDFKRFVALRDREREVLGKP